MISALSGMRGIRLSWPRLQTDVAHGAKEQLKEQNVNPWLRPELNLNSLSLLGDRWRLVDLEDPVKSQKKKIKLGSLRNELFLPNASWLSLG